MKYSKEEVIQYVQEEDVKFIRLAFCDVFGKQKNISIMPDELPRAFEHGIAFDASAVAGFGDEAKSDLLLHPEPETLMPLPWRPEHGRVIQLFSGITRPDGTPFECDTRNLLKNAVEAANNAGCEFTFGAEQEFYLFYLDEDGNPTKTPCDTAGYMDIAPEDHGENVRREICLTLEQMGIRPESSHHEQGPGQNEIDFHYGVPLDAADQMSTFMMAVRTIAGRNGLYADFSPVPLKDKPGNGYHINIFATDKDGNDVCKFVAVLCDTHTGVAVRVYEAYRAAGDATPSVIVSTASPYKFSKAVLGALTDGNFAAENEFDMVSELETLTGMPAPAPLKSLKGKTPRFTNVCAQSEMEAQVYGLLGIKD